MTTAKMTSKGQVTIPKTVRDSLHLHTGDRIEFLIRGDSEAVLRPVTKTVDEVYGRLHQANQPAKTVDEMNEAVSSAMRKRGG